MNHNNTNASKAVVLSSGGVDSTSCCALAVEKYGRDSVSSVSIFYGQKHNKELECARRVSEYYGIRHYEFDIASIMAYSDCSLLKGSDREIVHKSYDEQIKENGEGKVSTCVPFRNGLMLSICASLAQSVYEKDDVEIYIGAHADDAAGNAYADCSEEFIDTMSRAVQIGTYNQVRVTAPFAAESKAQAVKKGLELKAPFHLTWSCYEGGDLPCGECATCIDRAKAFAANGVADPALVILQNGFKGINA